MTDDNIRMVDIGAMLDTENPAEVGHCALCGQEMIRTVDDCWHPFSVATACPPEDVVDGVTRARFGEFFHPGREHFRAGPRPSLADLGVPYTVAQLTVADSVPKVVEATLTVRSSDGSLTTVTFAPEESGTLTVAIEAVQPVVDIDVRQVRGLASWQVDTPREHKLTVDGVGHTTIEHLVRPTS